MKQMVKLLEIVFPVFVMLTFYSCAVPGKAAKHFTYPSAMTLGYLPETGVRTLFIANTFTGTISEINTSTNNVMPITAPTSADAIRLNMYPQMLEYSSGYLYIAGFTKSTGLIEALSLSTNQTTSTVYLKGYPLKTIFIHKTSMLFVLDAKGNNFYLESFTVSSAITPAAFTTLTFTPSAMASTPDNSRLFISYRNKPFLSEFNPTTLKEIGRIAMDYPVILMDVINQYEGTILYAIAHADTGYQVESLNIKSGRKGYSFSIPGIPDDFAISSRRVLLDDNHFSYLGIVTNADGYIHFLNIDYGCNIPSIPSAHTGIILTSSVAASAAPSIRSVTTNDCTTKNEAWSVVYDSIAKNYTVTGTTSGPQPHFATTGAFFVSTDNSVSFYINPGSAVLGNGDLFTFNTIAASGIKMISNLGLPEHVIVDPTTDYAYITDVLTNSIYLISPTTQQIIVEIK